MDSPGNVYDGPIGDVVVAAAAGSQDAAHNLGVAHYRGFGTLDRNLSVARAWFVEAGNPEAMTIVAQIDAELQAYSSATKRTNGEL